MRSCVLLKLMPLFWQGHAQDEDFLIQMGEKNDMVLDSASSGETKSSLLPTSGPTFPPTKTATSSNLLFSDGFDTLDNDVWEHNSGLGASNGVLSIEGNGGWGGASNRVFYSKEIFTAPLTMQAKLTGRKSQCVMLQFFPNYGVSQHARHSGYHYCGLCCGAAHSGDIATAMEGLHYNGFSGCNSGLKSIDVGTAVDAFWDVRLTVNAAGTESNLYIKPEGLDWEHIGTKYGSQTTGHIGFNDNCVDVDVDYVWLRHGVQIPTTASEAATTTTTTTTVATTSTTEAPLAGAYGDPHCVNAKGDWFDIHAVGRIPMVILPLGTTIEDGDFAVIATTTTPDGWDKCAPTFISAVDVWANQAHDQLRVDAGPAGDLQVKPMTGSTEAYSIKMLSEKVMITFRSVIVSVILNKVPKIDQSPFLYFDMEVAGLQALKAGGILGSDPHDSAQVQPDGCSEVPFKHRAVDRYSMARAMP